MDKKTLAKIAGWLGAGLNALAGAGLFGKYTPIVTGLALALVAVGVQQASETSAGHPNGSNTLN